MDPQTLKLVQRIIAEVAGIGLLIWGIIFIYRGIAGKIKFIMQGAGLKVKLANASPGVFIALLGCMLIWYSMKDFSIQRTTTETESPANQPEVLDQWLSNTSRVTGNEDYIKTIDLVVGADKENRFKVSYEKIHPPESLGEIARKTYGDPKYWKLVAVANIGKGYFEWAGATPDTKVADSSLLEIWKVSKYYGKSTSEVIKISAYDKKQAYQEMMELAKAKPDYHPQEHVYELTQQFKAKELSLVQTPVSYSGGVETIGDISLKYYGEKTFWPLIVWTNPEELASIKGPNDRPDQSRTIFVLHFIP